MRRPYTRPGRRASDCTRASRACAGIVHICTPIRTYLRVGKGQETRRGRRINDFLYLARQRGGVSIFVPLSAPTIRVPN